LLKIIAGWGLAYYFAQKYPTGGDINYYHRRAVSLSSYAKDNLKEYACFLFSPSPQNYPAIYAKSGTKKPRELLMIKMVSVAYLLTGQNTYLTSVIFSLLAFLGWYLCAATLTKLFPEREWIAAISFLYMPSTVFWSAGTTKEAILAFCLSVAVAVFLIFTYLYHTIKKSVIYQVTLIICFLGAAYLMVLLKYYYAATLFPIIISCYMVEKFNKNTKLPLIYSIILFLFLIGVGAWVASFLHPNLHLEVILSEIVQNNLKMVAQSNDTSLLIYFIDLKPTLISFLVNLPAVSWQALLRPYLWECREIYQLMASLENTLITLLMGYTVFKIVLERKMNTEYVFLSIACILFFGVLLMLLAFSSPNIGNLVRYKSCLLPFITFFCLQVVTQSAIPNHSPQYKL
jgi:hypothetical protein